jgi:hypothetical protein
MLKLGVFVEIEDGLKESAQLQSRLLVEDMDWMRGLTRECGYNGSFG